MKILIIYDSVSPGKNTEKVANEISEIMKQKEFVVNCLSVSSFDKSNLKNYDCVLVGSPTMGWSATAPVKQFLKDFIDNEFSGKYAAAFDTRVKSRLSGQASKGIQEKLEKLGFKIIMPPLFAYVEGSTQKNDYVLKDGELDKVKKYADDLARALQKYLELFFA